jgi:ribokinase
MAVCVLGSINLDTVYRVARIPVVGETIMAEGQSRFAGGKGANQAVAASAWGAPTMLIGALGQDEPGDFLLAHLAGAAVETRGVARLAEAPSGQAFICVSHGGENIIVVLGGANRAVTSAQVEGADITGRRVFLAQLETPPEAIEALFRRPEAVVGTRILNAAPAVTAGFGLLPLTDILVVNQGELAL